MNVEDFRNYCLSFPGCEEKMPFEKFFRGRRHFLVFYVHGKMFCYFDIDRFDHCTIKCPPEDIEELAADYNAVIRPYNADPKYWISLKFNDDMPDNELRRLVRQSYEIVGKAARKRKK